MRRWIAAALTASAVIAATPAYAQTSAPPSPVKALTKQFVAGQGVKLRETTSTWVNGEEYAGATREGTIELGAKGIVGAETTRNPVMSEAVRNQLELAAKQDPSAADAIDTLLERIYQVSVGNKLYVNGGIFSLLLPDDKLWLTAKASNASAAYGDQLINIFEPATLKKLLATATSKRPSAYKGSITLGDLYAVSPTFREMLLIRPKGLEAKATIGWKLYLDEQSLAKRLSISLVLPISKKLKMKVVAETRYFDWGTSVKVTAPPAESVAKIEDLAKTPPDVPAVVDKNYVSVPPDDEGKTE